MTVQPLQPAIARFLLLTYGLGFALILFCLVIGKTLCAEQIVFLSNRDGLYNLYGMDIGRNLALKLSDREIPPSFRISPNGQRILFTQAVNDLPVIFTMSLNGTNARQLVDRPGTGASWSPDSQSIIFTILDESNQKTSQIYRINSDGTSPQPLTEFPASPYTPSWSPDGKRITFEEEGEKDERTLYLMDADGSNLHRLNYSKNFAGIFGLHWSPDSHSIAFIGEFFNDDHSIMTNRLCISEVASGQINCFENADIGILSNSILNALDWSPDNTRIAFVSIYGMNIANIMILNLQMGVSHRILRYGENTSVRSIGNLTWTPDGSHLIFEAIGRMGPIVDSHLRIIAIDGSGERILTSDSFSSILPSWWPGE